MKRFTMRTKQIKVQEVLPTEELLPAHGPTKAKKLPEFILRCAHQKDAKGTLFCGGEVVRCVCGVKGRYTGKKAPVRRRPTLQSAEIAKQQMINIENNADKLTQQIETQADEDETKVQALLLLGAIAQEDKSVLLIQKMWRAKQARQTVATQKAEMLRKMEAMIWPKPGHTQRFEFKESTKCLTDTNSALFSKGQHLLSDIDTDGVLFWLGTHGGTHQYQNPHESNQVVAELSTKGGWGGSPEVFVNHGQPTMPNGTKNVPHSWMSVDFGKGRTFQVEYYALRHGMDHGGSHMKFWRLEGSNDGELWIMLREHAEESVTLSWTRSQGFACAVWELKKMSKPYRHFRIMMTGLNCQANHILYCAGIDFYGTLRVE
jgi:hypothetical protein